ncbi:MAG TPA: hypothetical protein VFD32_10260, partial [Dehalococcoidia bacterium]|nr:hypothetical protein [Dehalococcoidia bacterium]
MIAALPAMAAFSLLTRTHRAGVLWNVSDHMIQVARLGRLDEKPLPLDRFAEFGAHEDEAVAGWLREQFADRGPGYLAGYCGFHPAERVLLRETVNSRRLVEPHFLEQLLAEHAKLPPLKDWQVGALHPVDGELFTPATPARPGLLFGLPLAPVRDTQQRLRKLGIRPQRLELGTVALLGALTRYTREIAYPHAVVVCEIGHQQTRIYFLAKDGVHTPATLPHGLLSIEETAMKELAAPDIARAREQLAAPTDELRSHGRRLVRMLTRHLKPAVDYFEMQTGQPIGALYCAHLPAKLGWLEETLCAAIDLEFLVPDLATWLPASGLQLGPDTAPPG